MRWTVLPCCHFWLWLLRFSVKRQTAALSIPVFHSLSMALIQFILPRNYMGGHKGEKRTGANTFCMTLTCKHTELLMKMNVCFNKQFSALTCVLNSPLMLMRPIITGNLASLCPSLTGCAGCPLCGGLLACKICRPRLRGLCACLLI